MSFTPGPWEIDNSETISVRAADGSRLCTLNWLRGPAGRLGRIEANEVEANARLIASAPALLETLKEVLPFVQDDTLESVVIDNGPHLTRADLARMCAAVIAKATGE